MFLGNKWQSQLKMAISTLVVFLSSNKRLQSVERRGERKWGKDRQPSEQLQFCVHVTGLASLLQACSMPVLASHVHY